MPLQRTIRTFLISVCGLAFGLSAQISIALIFFSLPCRAEPTAFEAGMTNPNAVVSPAERAFVQNHTTVMIQGFLNETFVGGYFSETISTLRGDYGAHDFEILSPSSRKRELENAQILARNLLDIYERHGRKPLFVIAHSKGGAEMLLAALQYTASLISSGVVDRIVLAQAALGGSPVADLLTRIRAGLDHERLCNLLLGLHDGLTSLVGSESKKIFQSKMALLDPASKAILSSKVFYVRGRAQSTAPALLLTHKYLNRFGENDGLVLTADQKLEGFGTDLGLVEADHDDLFMSMPYSRKPYAFRQQFMQALVAEMVRTAP